MKGSSRKIFLFLQALSSNAARAGTGDLLQRHDVEDFNPFRTTKSLPILLTPIKFVPYKGSPVVKALTLYTDTSVAT